MRNFAKLYEDLGSSFSEEWKPNKDKDGVTFSPRHRILSKRLSQLHGKRVRLQLWIHKEVAPNQLDLEFAGQFQGRGDQTSELRKLLANKEQHPKFEEPDGETIIIRLPLDGNHKEQTTQIRAFVEYVSAKLRGYDLPSATTSTFSNSRPNAVNRMVSTALQTIKQSGESVATVKKVKDTGFDSEEAFKAYVQDLVDQQQGLCKLSDLPFVDDNDQEKSDYRMSLDRIDSDGRYEPDNLQIVCRFINRWKSDSDNERFKKLLASVQTQPTAEDRTKS